jgi:hypothetical protein
MVAYFVALLEYLTANWYILLPFGTFCGHLVSIFFRFGIIVPKNLATLDVWSFYDFDCIS